MSQATELELVVASAVMPDVSSAVTAQSNALTSGALTSGALTSGALTNGASANSASANSVSTPWREIDRQLRRVAKAQAALDAEELRWLALAQEVDLHRELGMASMLEYVERVLGHGPKAAHERLRVARELRE
jgi:hypothetical protein